ncbi:Uncharacterized protein APZ42_000481 [Daphnia magna]|uniref:Uncharacterized protein n=1 Tax=Daphnia magna TaxID=35525 RepID=A0A162C9E1_9CRUS|nr:Uncharacterized protein APZ42_000481 [Daphnia magna]
MSWSSTVFGVLLSWSITVAIPILRHSLVETYLFLTNQFLFQLFYHMTSTSKSFVPEDICKS